MTAAELRVAADRAETYPPGKALHWVSDLSFLRYHGTAARFLREHPEMLEAG